MSHTNFSKTAIYPIFLPFLACKTKCIFCEQSQITSQSSFDNIVSFNAKNIEQINDTIKNQISLYKNYYNHNENNIKEIKIEVAFYGGSFSCINYDIRKKMYEVALEHLKSIFNATNLQPIIRYSTRPDCILQNTDNELEEECKLFNLRTIELGVQTLTDNALEKNKRPYNSQDVINAIEKLTQSSNQFTIGLQLMPGMYEDTPENFINSIITLTNLATQNSKNKIEYARIYPCLVLKNTELEQIYNQGKYQPLDKIEVIALSTLTFILLESANIHVIRIELPPMSDEKIVAGYYHQALGDLVRTFTLYLYLLLFIDDNTTILIKSKDNSKLNGYKGVTRSLLKSKKCEVIVLQEQLTKTENIDNKKLFIVDYNEISAKLVNHILSMNKGDFISFYNKIIDVVKTSANTYPI